MTTTTFKALKEFAKALGAKIKREHQDDDGTPSYVLYDAKGEALVTEYDTNDMLDSLAAHYGGHKDYTEAKTEYELAVGA